jgi:hypothetical protein
MDETDNKDNTVRPADKESNDYRLDERETSSVQTANSIEQSEEGATAGSDDHPERNTPTTTTVSDSEVESREIEVTTKINAAIVAHNMMAISRGEEVNAPAREAQASPYTKLSAKVSSPSTKYEHTDTLPGSTSLSRRR